MFRKFLQGFSKKKEPVNIKVIFTMGNQSVGSVDTTDQNLKTLLENTEKDRQVEIQKAAKIKAETAAKIKSSPATRVYYKDYVYFQKMYEQYGEVQTAVNKVITVISSLKHGFYSKTGEEIPGLKEEVEKRSKVKLQDFALKAAKNLAINGVAIDNFYKATSLKNNKTYEMFRVLPTHELSDFWVNENGLPDEQVVRFDWNRRQGYYGTSQWISNERGKREFYLVNLQSNEILGDSRLTALNWKLDLVYLTVQRISAVMKNGGSLSRMIFFQPGVSDIIKKQIETGLEQLKDIKNTGRDIVINLDTEEPKNTEQIMHSVPVGDKILEKEVNIDYLKYVRDEILHIFTIPQSAFDVKNTNSGKQTNNTEHNIDSQILEVFGHAIETLGNEFRFKYYLDQLESEGWFAKKYLEFENKRFSKDQVNPYEIDGKIVRPSEDQVLYEIRPHKKNPSIEEQTLALNAYKVQADIQAINPNYPELVSMEELRARMGYDSLQSKKKEEEEDRQKLDQDDSTNNQNLDSTSGNSLPLNPSHYFTIEEVKPEPKTKSVKPDAVLDIQDIANGFFDKKNKDSLRLKGGDKKKVRKDLNTVFESVLKYKGVEPKKGQEFSKVPELVNTKLAKEFKNTLINGLEEQYLDANISEVLEVIKKPKKEKQKALDPELVENIKKNLKIKGLDKYIKPEQFFKVMDSFAQVGKLEVEEIMEKELKRGLTSEESAEINKALENWITKRITNLYNGLPEGETASQTDLENPFYSEDSLNVYSEVQIANTIAQILEANPEATQKELEKLIKESLKEKAENRIDRILQDNISKAFAIGLVFASRSSGATGKTWIRTVTPVGRRRGDPAFPDENHLNTANKTIPFEAKFIHTTGQVEPWSQSVINCRCSIRPVYGKIEFTTVEGVDYVV